MRRQVARVVGRRSRANLAAAGGAAAALVAAHVLVPHLGLSPAAVTVVRYTAYLTVFAIWMGWFVVTGVRVWRAYDDS